MEYARSAAKSAKSAAKSVLRYVSILPPKDEKYGLGDNKQYYEFTQDLNNPPRQRLLVAVYLEWVEMVKWLINKHNASEIIYWEEDRHTKVYPLSLAVEKAMKNEDKEKEKNLLKIIRLLINAGSEKISWWYILNSPLKIIWDYDKHIEKPISEEIAKLIFKKYYIPEKKNTLERPLYVPDLFTNPQYTRSGYEIDNGGSEAGTRKLISLGFKHRYGRRGGGIKTARRSQSKRKTKKIRNKTE